MTAKHIHHIIMALLCLWAASASAQPEPEMERKSTTSKKKKTEVKVAPSYAWTISDPLGLQYPSTIDSLADGYHLTSVPSLQSKAFATTGNYGAPGQDQIFFDRSPISAYFHEDALSTWLNSPAKQRFYNTRIPMTILGHTTGGDKYSNQDRTIVDFSGNATKRLQIGASLDYIYSKGSYDYQAAKNFMWNATASYIGDRYEMQAMFLNYNSTHKESGGILDDRYITDPAAVQGGETKVAPKDIPSALTASQSNMAGHQLVMNHRYKVGYYKYQRDSITDTIIGRTYIPVTSFIWNFDYKISQHRFLNESPTQDSTFFAHNYLSKAGTNERNRYWRIRNTLGVSLLEGFNKYAKFGFAIYAQHEIRRYTQVNDSILGTDGAATLDAIPCTAEQRTTQNLFWVGGQLTKQQGSVLTYDASARFGVLGEVKGDIDVSGDVATRIRLLGDTVTVRAYGYFRNLEAPYLLKHFVSNHYAWDNSFSKETRFRVGGILDIPWTRTSANVGYETLKNYLYFGTDGTPAQCGSPVHVLSASLKQRFAFRALHFDADLTYQTSSNDEVLPLPKFAVYGNLYIKFSVAKVLHVQLGADCNYYTKYYAPAYNPALMNFHNQREVECGNFAFGNVYADCRMKQARFYIAYTHFNKGVFGGKNYFAVPHYPLNPARFQIGVSVNFIN